MRPLTNAQMRVCPEHPDAVALLHELTNFAYRLILVFFERLDDWARVTLYHIQKLGPPHERIFGSQISLG
jgi:hypothetical protein